MKVYLVKVNGWEENVDCVCATKEIALRECERLAKVYNIDKDDDCIQCTEMEVIEE